MVMRMTADRADKIAKAITQKALKIEYEAQQERMKACPELLYTIYREYVEDKIPALNAVDPAFLDIEKQHNFVFIYTGDLEVRTKQYAVTVVFEQELPVPVREYRPIIRTNHPSFVAYDTIMSTGEELARRANTMRDDVKRNALAVGSVDKLMKAWPDAAQLIAEVCDYAVPPAVPYVPLHELMAKYARMLPAPGAANDGTVEEE